MSAARLAKSAIKIPKYIERGPTDILKALSATINYIPKEPELMLHDDPYLLPTRPAEKRNYILSRMTGQKTAKFFLNKHPELFFRDDAEPKVEAFCPKEEFNSEMEFTEEDVIWCIDSNDPANGIIAYESLIAKNIKLSNKTLLQFFEMICFTNEENLKDWLDYERSRFVIGNSDELVDQTWRTTGLASKIFNQIKEDLDPSRVYSAMISGLSKFNEHSTAKQVFNDFKELHLDKGLYICAYDGLLRSVRSLHSSISTTTEAIVEIINHMEANLVKPDLLFFNSLLECYSYNVVDQDVCQQSFKLINDMRSLNIEPSLATFSILMKIVGKFKAGRVYGEIIPDILAHVESFNDIQIRDCRDVQFLCDTMFLITNKLNSLTLAKRLHKLYLAHPHLFVSANMKARYLNNYFKLILTTDTLENILEYYDNYVPSSFRPNEECFDIFAEALDLYNAPDELVKKIGQDIIAFRLVTKLKNDAIFRKDPSYLEAYEQQMA